MPAGFVQLIYRTGHADGEKLVSHPLIGAVGYTGSRERGAQAQERPPTGRGSRFTSSCRASIRFSFFPAR